MRSFRTIVAAFVFGCPYAFRPRPVGADDLFTAADIIRKTALARDLRRAGERLQAERLALFRSRLEAPLRPLAARWYAAWRAVGRASAAGDLDAAPGGLAAAAQALGEIKSLCRAWADAGEAWLVGTNDQHPDLCIDFPAYLPASSMTGSRWCSPAGGCPAPGSDCRRNTPSHG